MLLKPIQPKDALNQAYRKVKPFRKDIDAFRQNLLYLIGQVDDAKDEENHKTEMRDFLKKTYFGEDYYFNVKKNIDWAIFNGSKSTDSVGVIIEAKVDQILTHKKENPQADTSALEKEIDQMVYEFYGLSGEEIKIVEGLND